MFLFCFSESTSVGLKTMSKVEKAANDMKRTRAKGPIGTQSILHSLIHAFYYKRTHLFLSNELFWMNFP